MIERILFSVVVGILWCTAPAHADDKADCARDFSAQKEALAACGRLLAQPDMTLDERAWAITHLAQRQFRMADLNGVKTNWETFRALGSTDVQLWVAFGRLLIGFLLLDDAAAAFDRAVVLAPASLEAALGRVEVEYGRRRLASATTMAKDLAARFPKEQRAWLLLGRMQLDMGRFDDATSSLQEAKALVPSTAEVSLYLGLAQVGGRRFAEGIAALTEFLDLEPAGKRRPDQQMAALETRARARVEMGTTDAAVDDLAKAIEIGRSYPGLSTAALEQRRADLLRRSGKASLAFEAYLETAERQGQDAVLRLQLALRRAGYGEVGITGKIDDATRGALRSCSLTPKCEVLRSL